MTPSPTLLASLQSLRDQGVPFRPLASLKRREGNPRDNAEAVPSIVDSLQTFGWTTPMLIDPRGELEAGDTRYLAAAHLGLEEVPVIETQHDERMAKLYVPADNRLGEIARWNIPKLDELFRDYTADEIRLTGWEPADISAMLARAGQDNEMKEAARRSLAERFGAPPFSVLDARQGYWQDRKRTWIALGIQSEIGRGENLLNFSDAVQLKARSKAAIFETIQKGQDAPSALLANKTKRGGNEVSTREPGEYKGGDAWLGAPRQSASHKGGLAFGTTIHPYDGQDGGEASRTGTSIFDPVLTELLVRWFCPEGGRVLDPFAGGSVRGVVSGWLGRSYVGVELRREQVEANREQGREILVSTAPGTKPTQRDEPEIADPHALTPVLQVSDAPMWLKADHRFAVNGVTGAKARAGIEVTKGAVGLVCAGSRHSPMVSRVARLAEAAGIPARCYTAHANEYSDSETDAVAHGADLIRPTGRGFLKRLIGMARKDAEERGWTMVELGLDADCYVPINALQVANVPDDVQRIVCPVGSGMGLASILAGLDLAGRKIPVLGVRVSDRPIEDVLDRRAPKDWRERVSFAQSELEYEEPAPSLYLGTERLDPTYEAKCLPFLQAGDLLWSFARASTTDRRAPQQRGHAAWIEGDARDLATLIDPATGEKLAGPFDFFLTCPPYADLEVYSEDPRDLSTMSYPDFSAAMERVIAASAPLLREHAFAAIVVGEVRGDDRNGSYRGFVPDTIRAFEKAGLRYYNEAILVTAVGRLPVRAGRAFEASRKLGKTHQNVLVFVKGDVEQIVPRLERPLLPVVAEAPAEPAPEPT